VPITRTAPSVLAILAGAMLAAACSGGSPTSPSATAPGSATNASSTATNIAGAWTVTITASPICTPIPSAVRRRAYAATITQSGANVAVNLGGQTQNIAFSGTISGRNVQWYFAIFEQVTQTSAIATSASAATTLSASAMSADFTATYDYYDFETGRQASCNAANHQLSFTRR
jgi:hypothetical protein